MSLQKSSRRDQTEAAAATPSVQFEAVEPRVLFSATAMEPVAAEAHHEVPAAQEEMILGAVQAQEAAVEATPEDEIVTGLNHRAADLEGTERKELVFVSGGLFDDAYLTQHLAPAYEVHVIEPGTDGIRQIAAVLEGREGINAIHLVSHGEEGQLFLGDSVLDVNSMEGEHGEWLRQIGLSLADEADILIYGCEFGGGEEGEAAATLLGELTGAEVATSTDKTGHAELGGDWVLETATGEVEASSLAMTDWRGLLAAPTVSVPSADLSTLEDQAFTFNGANLISVNSDTYTTLTVNLSVGQGALTLPGVAGITFLNGTLNGSSNLQISGTITNLNAALNGLIFTPALNTHGIETIAVTVTDQASATSSTSKTVSVISQNDAPDLVVNPINASATGTPSETASHTFNLSNIVAVDPDNSNNQLTYIIESLPANGALRLNGFPVAIGSIFNQSALASGALVYIHNGGENHSDSFILTVNDGAGGSDPMVTIPITITPVNDAMSVSTQAVVYEGGSTRGGAVGPGKPVPALSLSISDVESDLKTVTITSLPGGGVLSYNGTTITQTMINAGFSFSAANFSLLEYVHNGVDDLGTRPSNRSFNISVVDQGGGAGAGAIRTVNHTVNITVVGVNDELNFVNLRSTIPTIASGQSYTLGLADMEVSDPDGSSNQITYTLVSSPLHGQLRIAGQLSGAGATFTQAQLAAGQVVFTNGGANAIDTLNFRATDSQISILTDQLGTLRVGNHTTAPRILQLQFQLTATPGGGGTTIRLDEGQSLSLPGAVQGNTIKLTTAPAEGSILVNGSPLAVGTLYTVQAGDTVVYDHDGDHIDTDGFTWEVNGVATPVTVNVLLTNDSPLLLIVTPVTGIREGFSGAITTAHLQVSDEETTDPARLVYTVTSAPSGGNLLRNGVAIPTFGSFTHQDVIDGLITYQHNGAERFLDNVSLIVSDGSATSSNVLPIQIVPVNDQPSVTSNFMELVEGGLKAFTSANLGVSDADGVGADIVLAPDSPIQIRIESLPAHGSLYYNDPTLGMTLVGSGFVFNHSQIGRLHYQHDSSENFSDSFGFTVLDNNTYTNPGFDAPGSRAGTMNLGMIPLNDAPAVTVNAGLVSDVAGDRRVYEGGTRVLTTAVLDSFDPDSTDEQVQYRITAAPVNGTLLLNGVRVAPGTAFTQADLASGKLSYRHNGSETTTDQFRFRIDDGASNVPEATFQIGIVSVNDAPVISAPSNATVNTADYHFTGARTISVSDNDAATGTITVTLTASEVGGRLRVTTTTGLTSVTGNDTSNVLVLVGQRADINNALATLRYRAADLDSAATLTVHVNDGGNSGVDPSQVPVGEIPGLVNTGTNTDEQATRVVNLLVSPIDDAPVNTVPGAQTAYEDVLFTFNSANGNLISISDVDAFGGEMQVTLSVLNGRLTLGSTANLTFSAGDGTSDTTMTFRGNITAINTALNGLRYLGNSNYAGAETLTITTNDLGNTGDGGPLSASNTIGINVLGVNDAPTISGPGSTVLVNAETFAFNGGNTISVADTDSASGLVTVTLTVNDPSGLLAVSTTTGLSSVSGNGSSNVLTFSGTVADVNAALASLVYTPADIDGAATLTVLVNDNGNTGVDPSVISLPHTGTTSNEQATRIFNLTVSDINDAPVNTVPTARTVNEDTNLTFNTANGNAISISDADAFNGIVTTTVSVLNGTVTAGGTAPQRAALTSMTGSGTNTLTLSGTVTQINAVLQGLVYRGTSHFNGSDTLTIRTNDNGNTGIGGALTDEDTVAITVTPVNDTPTNTVPSARTVAEDGSIVFSAANSNQIRVADVDVNEGTGLLTVTLGVTNGTLTLSGITGLSFASGDGNADSSMTFTGTVTNINAALSGMRFNPTPDYNGAALLTLTTNDNGNTGSGGARSATNTVAITVTAVADITADSVTTQEDNAITFDVIAGTNGATADSFEGTPVLTQIGSTTVTAGSVVPVTNGSVRVDATTGLLTFTPNQHFNGTTSFNYTVTSPTGVTESAQVTVTVQAVNDAPVNSVPSTQTFNEDTTRLFNVANGNVISISDVDAATGDVRTTLTVLNGSLRAGGTPAQQAALTSLTGNNTGTLVLTGTVSEVNAVLLGLLYTPNANFNGTDTLRVVTNDLGNTGLGGALSDTDDITLNLTAMNDAPANTVPVAQSVAEDTGLVFSSANSNQIRVADVDVNEGTGQLTVTLGVTNGTLTLFRTNGLSFTAGDGTADTSMIFTGTVNDINAALNGLIYNPTADYHGPAQLTITTNDNGNTGSGGALSAASTVAITVTPVVDVVNDVLSTDEDTPITFNVITGANNAEADSFSNPGRVITSHTNPAHGTLTVLPNGEITYSPDTNWHGTDTFQYTVTSGGVTETATVTITVNSVNDRPVAIDDTFSVPEDGSVTIDVLDDDYDVDGDVITITHVNGQVITDGGLPVPVANGSVALVGGKLVFTPTPDYFGPAAFNYTISDSQLSSTANVSGTVTQTPRALTIADVTVDESQNLVFTVVLNKSTSGPFTVEVSTIAGTATGAGTDFTSLSGNVLSFAGTKGETVTFTVQVNNDGLIENSEALYVVLDNISIAGVNITDTAMGTITDNDARLAPAGPGTGVTTDVELVANGTGGYDLIIEDVETNSPIGFNSAVPVADSTDNLLIYRDGADYVIRDTGGLWLGSPIVGAMRGATNEIRVPVAMVTGNIVVRSGIGDDVITIRNLGANLAGDLIVDAEDASDRYLDTDTIHYDSSSTLAAGGDARFRAETINGLASSRLQATGNGTILWDAGRNITIGKNASLVTNTGNVTLEANLDEAVSGRYQAIVLDNADITSTSGNVRVEGQGGDTSDRNYGVNLMSGSSIVTGGALNIIGTGGGDGAAAAQLGVIITGSQLRSSGLTVAGTGGNGLQYAAGVSIEKDSLLDSGTGNLTVQGTGGTGGSNNYGVSIAGSDLESDGGQILVLGTGSGTNAGIGVRLVDGNVANTGNGSITLRGTGASGQDSNDGVQIQSGTSITGENGEILIEGIAHGTGSKNFGVAMSGNSSASTQSGDGGITVRGTGGFGSFGSGIVLNVGNLTVGDGDLTVQGTGRGSSYGRGVDLTKSNLVSLGAGDIDIDGSASSAATGSHGAGVFGNGSTLSSRGTGSVLINGTGATGLTLNHGVQLSATRVEGAVVIAITGQARGTMGSATGVSLERGSVVAGSAAANVSISGSGSTAGAAGSRYHRGVVISDSTTSVVNGQLTIAGTGGGAGNGSLNHGVELGTGVIRSTGTGNIVIAGQGGRNGTGIHGSKSTISSASGNTNLTGNSGAGTKNSRGISLVRSILNSSGGGDITARGTAHANSNGTGNTGFFKEHGTIGTTGRFQIFGTGGGGSSKNHGVVMNKVTRTGAAPTVNGVKTDGSAKSFRTSGNFFD
jgi:hypothetical protein